MDTTIRKLTAPRGTLANWKPIHFPAGNERLSEEIDSIVYHVERPAKSRRQGQA